jgi:hypothetical protein
MITVVVRIIKSQIGNSTNTEIKTPTVLRKIFFFDFTDFMKIEKGKNKSLSKNLIIPNINLIIPPEKRNVNRKPRPRSPLLTFD